MNFTQNELEVIFIALAGIIAQVVILWVIRKLSYRIREHVEYSINQQFDMQMIRQNELFETNFERLNNAYYAFVELHNKFEKKTEQIIVEHEQRVKNSMLDTQHYFREHCEATNSYLDDMYGQYEKMIELDNTIISQQAVINKNNGINRRKEIRGHSNL